MTLINTSVPANAIIGGWATIGSTSTPTSQLDWATVSNGTVVPLAAYQPLVAAPLATDNSQLLASGGTVTLTAGNQKINSLSIGGTLLFNTTANVLTIASEASSLTAGPETRLTRPVRTNRCRTWPLSARA